MTGWLSVLAICLGLASTAEAAVLRISAEPPLSVERLADALRTYVDGVQVEVRSTGRDDRYDGPVPEPGVVELSLRRHGPADDDAELVLVDGEATILNRLPGAMRIEDLYRTAALKTQSLLQRRGAMGNAPVASIAVRSPTEHGDGTNRVWLDAGLAVLVPSAGLARGGLRLGVGLRFARRSHLSLGAYVEPEQSTRVGDVAVSAWELPFALQLGLDWHPGHWTGWLDLVGHVAMRRISAEAPGIVSDSKLALSPRVGVGTGWGIAIWQGLRFECAVSALIVLADNRYRVDGQVVWPGARALGVAELRLAYGGR
jgi:hypothetical protein